MKRRVPWTDTWTDTWTDPWTDTWADPAHIGRLNAKPARIKAKLARSTAEKSHGASFDRHLLAAQGRDQE